MIKKSKSIMIQGTGSGVGKSVLTAAIARYFYKRGIKTAPFKAQNMALNSFVTADGLEMGRAQVFQAQACGLEPDVRMNPILLKPNAENHSQVVLMGKARGNKSARDYYKDFPGHWKIVRGAFDSLASEYDLVVMEGAGSPAEINLQKTDLVNMRMAQYAGASVLIVGDIDRGGVFAWMKGTFDLIGKEYKNLVKGFIINKFRGDRSLLQPGIDMFEEMVDRPVVGVIPYQRDMWIDEEDSIPLDLSAKSEKKEQVAVGVVPLHRTSNFTDFTPLALENDVTLSFLKDPREMDRCDCVVLPGSKSTLSDARYLSRSGWFETIKTFKERGGTVVGICGGYQIMGETLSDPEGVEGESGHMKGIGLLPIATELTSEKILRRVTCKVNSHGYFAAGPEDEEATIVGYEIHMGRTEIRGRVHNLLESDDPSLCVASPDYRVFGTYIHGIFDSDWFRRVFINRLRERKGLAPVRTGLVYREYRDACFEKLEQLVENHLDLRGIS